MSELLPCPHCGSEAGIEEVDLPLGVSYYVACRGCDAQMGDSQDAYRESAFVAELWNRRTAQEGVGAVELQPKWGDFPWANFACLMPLTMGGDMHFQWYYYENMPWWGERNYNHTTGKWGAGRVIDAIPLSEIFDLRTTLRQRPSAAQANE